MRACESRCGPSRQINRWRVGRSAHSHGANSRRYPSAREIRRRHVCSGHTRSLWGTSKLPHGTTTPSQVSLQHESFTRFPWVAPCSRHCPAEGSDPPSGSKARARRWTPFCGERSGDSSTVEQRTLTPSMLVRIQVPQPGILLKSLRICSFLARRKSLETSVR